MIGQENAIKTLHLSFNQTDNQCKIMNLQRNPTDNKHDAVRKQKRTWRNFIKKLIERKRKTQL